MITKFQLAKRQSSANTSSTPNAKLLPGYWRLGFSDGHRQEIVQDPFQSQYVIPLLMTHCWRQHAENENGVARYLFTDDLLDANGRSRYAAHHLIL